MNVSVTYDSVISLFFIKKENEESTISAFSPIDLVNKVYEKGYKVTNVPNLLVQMKNHYCKPDMYYVESKLLFRKSTITTDNVCKQNLYEKDLYENL